MIRTVDGDISYSVKPGTQSGTRVRLKGKGVPDVRGRVGRGPVCDADCPYTGEAQQ